MRYLREVGQMRVQGVVILAHVSILLVLQVVRVMRISYNMLWMRPKLSPLS